MHMRLEDKLRLHLADKTVVWRFEGPGLTPVAVWRDGAGAHFVVVPPQPLTAASLVDAHVLALPEGASVQVVHEGPVGPVAQRTEERLGVRLLDGDALPAPPPAMALLPPEALQAGITPLLRRAVALPPQPSYDVPGEAFVATFELPLHAAPEHPALLPPVLPLPLLPAPMPEPVAAARDEAPAPARDPAPAPSPAAPPAAPPAPAPAPLTIDPPLPWDPTVRVPEPEPAFYPTPSEVLAMPWHQPGVADPDEHVELTETSRAPRAHHPTVDLAHHAPNWGLPWPRPAAGAPTEQLSTADPRLWNNPQRLGDLRGTLERMGAHGFGAVPAEGSAWLKRIQGIAGPR